MQYLKSEVNKPDLCRITEVNTDQNYVSPVVVNFEYGSDILSTEKPDDLKCKMFIDNKSPKNCKIIVSTEKQQFFGEVSSKAKDQPSNSTFLLIRNRKTNKVRIIAAASCILKNIEQLKQNKKKMSRDEMDSSQREEKTMKDKLNSIKSLAMSFGSKKSKRQSSMGLRMNLTLESNEEKIQETVSKVDVKLKEVENSCEESDDLLKLLPPCNREAESPQDVYNIDDILTEAERNSLNAAAQVLVTKKLTEADERSSFFLYTHFSQLGEEPSLDRVILLLYANSLVKFFNLPSTQIRNKSSPHVVCPQSKLIGQRIFKDFTLQIGNNRTRPNYMKDKLVCYLIVTILLALDFRLDMETLASSLKGFGQRKLLQLAKMAGVTPMSVGNTKNFALKIPLPSLPSRKPPKQLKRRN